MVANATARPDAGRAVILKPLGGACEDALPDTAPAMPMNKDAI